MNRVPEPCNHQYASLYPRQKLTSKGQYVLSRTHLPVYPHVILPVTNRPERVTTSKMITNVLRTNWRIDSGATSRSGSSSQSDSTSPRSFFKALLALRSSLASWPAFHLPYLRLRQSTIKYNPRANSRQKRHIRCFSRHHASIGILHFG